MPRCQHLECHVRAPTSGSQWGMQRPCKINGETNNNVCPKLSHSQDTLPGHTTPEPKPKPSFLPPAISVVRSMVHPLQPSALGMRLIIMAECDSLPAGIQKRRCSFPSLADLTCATRPALSSTTYLSTYPTLPYLPRCWGNSVVLDRVHRFGCLGLSTTLLNVDGGVMLGTECSRLWEAPSGRCLSFVWTALDLLLCLTGLTLSRVVVRIRDRDQEPSGG